MESFPQGRDRFREMNFLSLDAPCSHEREVRKSRSIPGMHERLIALPVEIPDER